jgi:hypothetical protein
MDPTLMLAAGAAAIALVVGGLRYFDRERQLKRTLARTPRTPIGQLGSGVVRVTGRAARVEETLTAPLSQRSCMAFQLAIDERRSHGNSTHWRPVVRVREARPFWVADDTGRVLVEPGSHFALALERDVAGRTGFLERLTGDSMERLEAFLASRGIPARNWFGMGKTFRYNEGVLEDGETVSVGGSVVAEPHPDGEASPGRGTPMRKLLRGSPQIPLLISDDPDAHGRG